LYVAPEDGSAAAVKLNPPLVAGGDVTNYLADPTIAVYRADARTDDVFELFATPVDGSGGTVRLSGALGAGGDVQESFAISPDGLTVVYRADQDVDERYQIYRVPIDGSAAPVRLNDPLEPNSDVFGFAIDPTSRHVLYVADAVNLVNELFD